MSSGLFVSKGSQFSVFNVVGVLYFRLLFGYKSLPRCGDLKPQFCKSRFIKGDNVLTNSNEVPKAPNTILGCVLWHY